jgi:Domain of unknown function (DUF1707)
MSETDSHYQQRQELRDASLRAGLRDASLRAGDRDRDRVADVLREQHLAGRLESAEFQERLDRCYAAKTYGELDELIVDLPREEHAPPVRQPRRWAVLALVAVIIAVISLSRGHLLWLAIPLFFFVGRPLLWGGAARRFGWGLMGCRPYPGAPAGRYV